MIQWLSACRRLTRSLEVDDSTACQAVSRLRLLVALGAAILLGATWKLWTPQTDFPRVPLFRVVATIPDAYEWLGAALLVASLAVTLLAPTSGQLRQQGLLLFSAAMAGMIVFDQQRLQTWAYQFAILGGVLSLVPPRRAVLLLRLFVISIYFHSALSKLHMGFLESAGPGQLLVYGLLNSIPFAGPNRWLLLERGLEVLLPLTELFVALMLFFARSQRTGLWTSLGMHLLLILALGPLGLNHKPGVLIWNGYFLLQNAVLFGPLLRRRSEPGAQPSIDASPAQIVEPLGAVAQVLPAARLMECFAVAVMLLPFLEPFGLFDVWPSWAVYAGGTEKVTVHVNAQTRDRLPAVLLEHTSTRRIDGWNRLMIDRWSLETLNAPINPEVRSHLGIALGIAQLAKTDDGVRVAIYSRADRWTGERTVRVLKGTAEIEQELDKFWLNGHPRTAAVPGE